MAAPGSTADRLTEAAVVYLNRLREAEEYGFTRKQAHEFADSDQDIGVLRWLLEHGCPAETAARILT